MNSSYWVDAVSLNIRSKPVIAPSTKIATLHQGQIVNKIEVSNAKNWWHVNTLINNITVTGYVNSLYLKPIETYAEPSSNEVIQPVHMSTSKPIRRSAAGGRAFPLNEADQPWRKSKDALGKINDLHKIINWLEVEKSPRYMPKASETYCNIYAYDYCYLSNVYLPRVWWVSKAILEIQQGKNVAPIYDKSIIELNANSLHNWLSEYGDDFGWQRTVNLTELQNRANEGAICVISARRKDLNRPGHICTVVPETKDNKAIYKNGIVTMPLQSNAGASNFRYGGSIWWTSEKFSSFSFWIHD